MRKLSHKFPHSHETEGMTGLKLLGEHYPVHTLVNCPASEHEITTTFLFQKMFVVTSHVFALLLHLN